MNHLERLAKLDTCAVSDALDNLDLQGATVGLLPLWTFTGVVVGRARTVQAGPRTPGSPQTHIASPLVAISEPDDVIVISNGGRTDVSCWGGILTRSAVSQGVAAVVIDGACRDILESAEHALPVYGLAVVPVSARSRIVQVDMDIRVTMAGVTVDSGDLVIADSCGVVFVPYQRADEVIAEAEAIVDREAKMIETVKDGRSIVTAMHDSKFTAAGQ